MNIAMARRANWMATMACAGTVMSLGLAMADDWSNTDGARAQSIPATPAPAIAPHASWSTLSFSNGQSAAWYDTQGRKLAGFMPQLYANRDAATRTPNLLYDAYPGLRIAGSNTWLNTKPVSSAGFDEQRGITRVVQRLGDVEITQWMWSPYGVDVPALAIVYDVRNLGTAPLQDAALFLLINAHVGGGAGQSNGERVRWTGTSFEETGALGVLQYRPSPAPTVHATSPDNPFLIVRDGGRLANRDDSGVRDDVVAGFEWDLGGLAAGGTKQVAWVMGHDANASNGAALTTALTALPMDPVALLAAERAQWDVFFAAGRIPAGISDAERAVYRQSMAMLRMGQVRGRAANPDGGDGQILASLPPGMWNISWVRDQAFAIDGMLDAGMLPESRAALEFWWRDQSGRGQWVCCDRDGGPWVGSPYALSVVRYFGNGNEETDVNGQGPNVEFDGFGLALAVTERYVVATGDQAFLVSHQQAIFDRTADVLVGLIEPSGPTAGLIRADSSIWETHWYDGGRQHTTFTQAAAVRGLDAAARLAARLGDSAREVRYQSAAATIRQAIVTRLVNPTTNILRASDQQTRNYLDAAASAAYLWDAIAVTHPSATATLAAFDAGLRNEQTGHGYRRNDDGGEYDLREWVSVDLWMAQLRYRRTERAAGDALLAWVTAQARLNFDVVPENYDRVTADYIGEVPMLGFGAAAYITTIVARGAVPPITPEQDGEPGTPSAASGCGCGSSGTSNVGMMVAVGLLVICINRRGVRNGRRHRG